MEKKSEKKHTFLPIFLVLLGLLFGFVGLTIGLGAGSSSDSSDDWLVPISTMLLFLSPFLVISGVFFVVEDFWKTKMSKEKTTSWKKIVLISTIIAYLAFLLITSI